MSEAELALALAVAVAVATAVVEVGAPMIAALRAPEPAVTPPPPTGGEIIGYGMILALTAGSITLFAMKQPIGGGATAAAVAILAIVAIVVRVRSRPPMREVRGEDS